ncbi:DinB family protein [Pararoseomonas sp. SCSIO 73927]|uniref:DinB family protein n=1 Tax=Pararoseomonas sp. SCSIO 73927 TaxID=3114537 RepID=UPI0030CCB29C
MDAPSLHHAALPYRAMARNNAWANHRLLTACEGLSQAEFVAPRTGFFPSLRATLNHILVIDRFYVDAMEGGTLGPAAWADPEPCATVAALKAAQAAVDARLIAIAEALDAAGLARIVAVHRGSRVQHERMDRLLLHLFQHDIHHRGQAHAMLSGTRVAPPQLDEFYAAEEAPLRAAEFSALGWTERTVWDRSDTLPE